MRGEEPLGGRVVGRVGDRVRDQVHLQVAKVTDGVEDGEDGEEDPAALVVSHVEVQGEEAVDSDTSEESDERPAHGEEEGGQAHSDPLS